MLPMYMSSNRIIAVAVISVAAVFSAGLLAYQAQALPLAVQFNAGDSMNASPGTALLSAGAAATGTPKPSIAAPMLEIHIANNGLVLLRDARVTAISGGIIRVAMVWGSTDLTWTIRTDSGTKFMTSEGEPGARADIERGDSITVTGMLAGSGTEPVIDAHTLRD